MIATRPDSAIARCVAPDFGRAIGRRRCRFIDPGSVRTGFAQSAEWRYGSPDRRHQPVQPVAGCDPAGAMLIADARIAEILVPQCQQRPVRRICRISTVTRVGAISAKAPSQHPSVDEPPGRRHFEKLAADRDALYRRRSGAFRSGRLRRGADRSRSPRQSSPADTTIRAVPPARSRRGKRGRERRGTGVAARFPLPPVLFRPARLRWRIACTILPVQIFAERVELAAPKCPVLLDPGRGIRQRRRDEPAVMHAADFPPHDQAAPFEHRQMLRDRRRRDIVTVRRAA